MKVHGRVTASPLQYGGGGGDYFWAAAEAAPDKTFIAYQGRELTFAQVNHLTAKTSAWLQSHCQSQPGDKVGILMPNCLPYVWTVLALMRLRVIIVPLNTRLTADSTACGHRRSTDPCG